jgi:hypothetical protein
MRHTVYNDGKQLFNFSRDNNPDFTFRIDGA